MRRQEQRHLVVLLTKCMQGVGDDGQQGTRPT